MWALVFTVLLPQGTQPSSKARYLGKTYGLYLVANATDVLNLYQYPYVEKIAYNKCGNSFLENNICCTNSKIGKTPRIHHVLRVLLQNMKITSD
jgi:hypothetical protein